MKQVVTRTPGEVLSQEVGESEKKRASMVVQAMVTPNLGMVSENVTLSKRG